MKNLTKSLFVFMASIVLFNSSMSLADQQIQDDLVVVGSICVGFDCINGESFGFDTLRLKENNLRIKLIDTSSSSSFPTRDWQITINDSINGGSNWIGIEDLDAGTTPLTILASAPNDSLYISSNGNVGFGTITPLVDVNVKAGNTPTLRLEQDTSSGFAEQTWDMGGNEANFFIRDVSNGSALPFRIMPSAPNGSLHIAADGDIGFETTTPDGLFDVAHSSDANNHAFLISPVSYVGINIDNGFVPNGLFEIQTTGGVSRFMVQSDGDVSIGTKTPSGRFDLRDVGDTVSYFNVDASGDVGVGTNAPNGRLDIRNAGNTESYFNIIGSGEVLVGAVSPVVPLEMGGIKPLLVVQGRSDAHYGLSVNATAAWTANVLFGKEGVLNWVISARNESDASTNDRLVFRDSAKSTVISLFQGGNVGFGVDTIDSGKHVQHSNGAYLSDIGHWMDNSSRALKENIVDLSIDAAYSALEELNPVTFNFKQDPDEGYAGFIAEDVPDLVAAKTRKHLSALDIVAVLTKVVQEQQQTIEKLNKRLDKLEVEK